MKTLLLTLLLVSAIYPGQKTVHDFTVKDIDGKNVSLKEYKGKVLMIVNVASMCGNTPQYKDIENLYKKLKDRGFVVLGFPANNFMGQEPGSDKDIKEFCTREYAVTFPMFSKVSVKGSNQAPLFKYLTSKSENGVVDSEVTWNFQKFIIGRDGKVIMSVSPRTSVNDPKVTAALEQALGD